MRKLTSLFAVLALSGAAISAQAQVTMTTTDRISGGYGVNIIYNGGTLTSGYTGPFNTTVSGSGFAYTNFDSYCVDLGHYLLGTEVVKPSDIKTAIPTSGAQIAYLYDTFAGSVGSNAAKGAALQIALWEVEYDYGGNGLNLKTGIFQFTSVVGDTAGTPIYNSIVNYITNAAHTGYLDNVPATFSGTATYLESVHPTFNTGQSLIGPANVPEPGIVSLFASSLVGLSAFAHRRRKA